MRMVLSLVNNTMCPPYVDPGCHETWNDQRRMDISFRRKTIAIIMVYKYLSIYEELPGLQQVLDASKIIDP